MMSLSTMMILMSCSVGFYHRNFLFFMDLFVSNNSALFQLAVLASLHT